MRSSDVMLLMFNPGRNVLTLLNDVTIMSIGSDVVAAILRLSVGKKYTSLYCEVFCVFHPAPNNEIAVYRLGT